ncbi:MAG: phage holin family protein [Dysgonamonadaceae bacterium]|jgi:uncharacterized membrane protein YqjE|nr:phage holin family protein [Dysgonamonadaceae bacterium]
MEHEQNLRTLISALKADTIQLINTKIELLKLESFEKVSRAGAFLIYGLIILNLLFFTFFFAFISLSFLIGNWMQNIAGGFAVVALVYLIVLIILFACRKSILTSVQNLFLKELDPDLKNDGEPEMKGGVDELN